MIVGAQSLVVALWAGTRPAPTTLWLKHLANQERFLLDISILTEYYSHPTLKTYTFKNNEKLYKSTDIALQKCTVFYSDGSSAKYNGTRQLLLHCFTSCVHAVDGDTDGDGFDNLIHCFTVFIYPVRVIRVPFF